MNATNRTGRHSVSTSLISDNAPQLDQPRRSRLWLIPFVGLIALIWFLVRVVPKPSRSAYPCQRVAAPLAGGFLLWLAGVIASVYVFRKARAHLKHSRTALAAGCLMIAAVTGLATLVMMPERMLLADNAQPNNPIGIAKGINPGRVVWVHEPDATDWVGPGNGHWWESNHTDQVVVDLMMSRAIRRLTNQGSDAQAWDALFHHFNQTHNNGDVGYQSGEKMTIKTNLVGCIDAGDWGGVDPATYDLVNKMDYMNTSPQMMLAVLRQLVYEAGVNQADISIGDPVALFPNEYYNILHSEFPNVHYLDSRGLFGRTGVQPSSTQFYWSTHPTGVTPDYVLKSYAEATYFIDLSNFKSHSAAGITLTAKNHYGSLRRPSKAGYFNMHDSLPTYVPGEGNYRAMVDLIGNEHTGCKAILFLIDGLYSGVHPDDSAPSKWAFPPFNNDWTNSVFASQDPIAIDSVGFDFMQEEGDSRNYPKMAGADDYMTEAALADNPPSGTFYDPNHAGDVTRLQSLGTHEHWTNSTDKQYSRNLGTGDGIELIQCLEAQSTNETINVKPAVTPITIDGDPGDWNLPSFTTYSLAGQNAIGDIMLVGYHQGTLYYGSLCTETNFQTPSDAADHTAMIYSRHDADYQYFLVRCDDQTVIAPFDVTENWRNDCVEFFIDPGHLSSQTPMWGVPDSSAFELVIDASNQQNVFMTTPEYRTQVLSGVTSAVMTDSTGWWLEARIAKNVTNPPLPAGGLFGLNIDLRDLDNAEETDRSLYTWSDDHDGVGGFPDKIPADWGDAYNPYGGQQAVPPVNVETLESKAGATITVDGNTDDWNLNAFTQKVYAGQNSASGDIALLGFDGNDGPYYSALWPNGVLPTNAADHSVTIYSRHDATHLYFLVEVLDSDIQTSDDASRNWANDCIEFYIDPGNDSGSTRMLDSTSDIQLVIDAANQKNVYMCTSGYTSQVLAGVTSSSVAVAGGWGLEVSIDKTALDPDIPAASGSYGLDFNFRDNDNNTDLTQTTIYTWADDTAPANFPSKTPDNWGKCTLGSVQQDMPPIIEEVLIDPETVPQGTDYTRQLTLLQGTQPITWSKVQGPEALDVDSNGYISGWMPTANDVGQTFDIEIEASNGLGSDTESWQVMVIAEAVTTETLNIKMAGAITVDGDASDWNLAEFVTQVRAGENTIRGDIALTGWDSGSLFYGSYWTGAGLPTDEADHTARVYARSDATHQYFLVTITDANVNTPSDTSLNWQNDCVEFYIDPGNDGGSVPISNSTSDVQLVIDAANQKNVYMCTSGYAAQVLAGVTSATTTETSGWTLEVAILKSAFDPDLPSGLGTFGLNIAYRDNDGELADPVSTMYTWSDDNTDAVGFPNKIPDNWGDAVADLCVSDNDCNDGNVCTDEVCNSGVCEYTNNTAPCDDELFCTATDVCSEGVCVGSGQTCIGTMCDEDRDLCIEPALLNEDFEAYADGDNPDDWFDTAAGNSMTQDDSLFKIINVDSEMVFGTTSTAVNIHSHYIGTGSDAWSSYTYTGRMKFTHQNSGIGVTFMSAYPIGDRYYRLRSLGTNDAFHISPHSTSVTGTTVTSVAPVTNTWYAFKIDVEDTGTQTTILAKVWIDGETEPESWQIDCYDDNQATRLTAGTIGVWSLSSGSKYWDDLKVNLYDDLCPDDPIKTEPGTCGCGVADSDDDNDAVIDCNDLCANTIPGATVDEFGCPLSLFCDFDMDGDVDANDVTTFNNCVSGPAVQHDGSATCIQADTDSDNDVDQSDFGVLQRCLSGENNPADPACGGQPGT